MQQNYRIRRLIQTNILPLTELKKHHQLKKSFLLILVISLALSCENSSKKIDFTYNTFNLTHDSKIEATIIRAQNKGIVSENINALIKDSIISNINEEKASESFEDVLHAFDEEYIQFKKDFPDSDGIWELSIESELVYESPEVVTISLNVYSYTGGAHGNDKIILLNIDPESGNALSNEDLIKDLNEFKKLSEIYFKEALNQDNKGLTMEDYFYGEAFHLPQNIGYSDDGLIMLYNVYEIASYAQGYTEFVIPFDVAENYLKRL